MREITTDAIFRLTCVALERTCFVMSEPGGTTSASPLPEATRFATITYRGPEHGSIVLAASEGFVNNLAAGLLGCAPTSTAARDAGEDALRELANILVGSVVRELGGANAPFLIGLPSACDRSAVPSASAIVAVVDAESERLEVHWIRARGALAA